MSDHITISIPAPVFESPVVLDPVGLDETLNDESPEEVFLEFSTPVMSTRDILEQATEYLRDHWVSGHWFMYDDGSSSDENPHWGLLSPHIVQPADLVTRACSMGAMLLAKQMHGAQRLGEALWDRLGDNDPAFRQAMVLLVRQITDPRDLQDWDGFDDWGELPTGELVLLITNWNDSEDRYRDEVINAFVAATKGAIKEEEAGAR